MAAKRLHHTDLLVWQKGMDLVVSVYALTRRFPKDERFGLTVQARRAAVSIPSNIAEGHGRLHRGDFVHHLSMANGSVQELDTLCRTAIRLNYVTGADAAPRVAQCEELGRMLSGLIRRLRAIPHSPSSIL
jgi:four helix bundle protein